MAECATCGNDYDKPLEIRHGSETHLFDCFECAIQLLAPVCRHCGCRIIGHGVEADGAVFCCAHCAATMGVPRLVDRADETLEDLPAPG